MKEETYNMKPTPMDDREKAAHVRVEKAMALVEAAQHTLEAACRELCPIRGASPTYRKVSDLTDQVQEMWYTVGKLKYASIALDREPDPGELVESDG